MDRPGMMQIENNFKEVADAMGFSSVGNLACYSSGIQGNTIKKILYGLFAGSALLVANTALLIYLLVR